MFIGHFALALGAKKYAPQVSLGILFLACQLADIIWPNLVLLGIETLQVVPGITVMTPLDFVHYPYSHSLIAILLWSSVFGVFYWLLNRSGTKAAIIIGLLSFKSALWSFVGAIAALGLASSSFTILALGMMHSPPVHGSLFFVMFFSSVALVFYSGYTCAIWRSGPRTQNAAS